MIGQKELGYLIHDQIQFDEFPRFSIIQGAEGSGKKTLVNFIAKEMGCQYTFIEPKVDAVREMIRNAYTVQTPIIYVLLNGDSLSPSAKNAMLKVCEETPRNAYIIMLVEDLNNVLETLLSRAHVYIMQPYTPSELLEYAQTDSDIITDLCETPGDVDKLMFIGAEEFYSYVEKVVDNIATVSTANSFKIAEKIATKGEVDKYDMRLFLRAFKSVCGKRMRQAVADNDVELQMLYSSGIKIVSNTLQQMNITGINKGALFDMFILDIRKEWF